MVFIEFPLKYLRLSLPDKRKISDQPGSLTRTFGRGYKNNVGKVGLFWQKYLTFVG